MKTFFPLLCCALFGAPLLNAGLVEELDMKTLRASSYSSVDVSRQQTPRYERCQSERVTEEEQESDVTLSGALRTIDLSTKRSQSVPSIVYKTLKEEENLKKKKNLEKKKTLKNEEVPVLVMNPLYGMRLVYKGTPRERLLMSRATNDPLFLDASQPHGLNLEAIHQRGEALRKLYDGGEDLASYVYTAQIMLNLLKPLEEAINNLAPKKMANDETLKPILRALQEKASRYHLALIPALRKISQMTGVSIEKLQFLPGREKN